MKAEHVSISFVSKSQPILARLHTMSLIKMVLKIVFIDCQTLRVFHLMDINMAMGMGMIIGWGIGDERLGFNSQSGQISSLNNHLNTLVLE